METEGKGDVRFPARIGREGKITIPVEIRNLYDLQDGDTVYVTYIRKLKPGEEVE
ncbi:MAG TPA: hypothetical protein VMW50_05205 [Dehalococcoidia bacterium]|nr:hypothetical protein [Dehalococcoidia bacterium]